MTVDERRLVQDALRALGVRRLVLGVFSQSFPAVDGEDLGRGTPGSTGATRFLEFAAGLGFTGIQLGPMGTTTAANPSPYDGSLFSKNPLDVAPRELVEHGFVDVRTVQSLAATTPAAAARHAENAHVWRAQSKILNEAWASHLRSPVSGGAFETFKRAHQTWLRRDALYDVLCGLHGGCWHQDWGTDEDALADAHLFDPLPGQEARCASRLAALLTAHALELERYAFIQWLIHRGHDALRSVARAHGLALYGDLQVGVSGRDAWSHQGLFLRDYRMGAPPSRTNPEGQPWDYAVFDPDRHDGAAAFLRARTAKLFAEFDGIRVDHPHGLVDPWVYRASALDALKAVREGARLFSAVDLPEHPLLARYGIARGEQLDRSQARFADGWVRSLDEKQVSRFSMLFDVLVDSASAAGHGANGLICEVLSTQPLPLRHVIDRHGLGRFRVAQKANLADPDDVYRCENARTPDWVMLGNHDTPPIWDVVKRWEASGALATQAHYVAGCLQSKADSRRQLGLRLTEEPGLLVQAHLANLLACPAENVQIFFTDLLGMDQPFNRPGTIRDDNWSLRVPPGYAESYRQARKSNAALHLPRALAMALRARGIAEPHQALIAALESVG